MSIVTIQPESVLAEGVHDCRFGGASTKGSRWIERRRTGSPGDAPVDILTRLPALVVLERIPVPSLAMARDGIILFANTAFAEMVGYGQDRLAGADVPCKVFHTRPLVPPELCALSGVDALANLVVEWSTVRVGPCGPG